jgi:hypothetical protein
MAETEQDGLALIFEAARIYLDKAIFCCPLSFPSLYRKALLGGYKTLEIHNLMAFGPYDRPEGIWMPSSAY